MLRIYYIRSKVSSSVVKNLVFNQNIEIEIESQHFEFRN